MTSIISASEMDSLVEGNSKANASSHARGGCVRRTSRPILILLLLALAGFFLWNPIVPNDDNQSPESAIVPNDDDQSLDNAMHFDTANETVHKYNATQFISFTINTMGGSAAHGECDGKGVDPESGNCYLGNYDITKDIRHRLQIAERVLNRIKLDRDLANPDIDHAPNVLKICMFPEFFLRGPHGAYSVDQLHDGLDSTGTQGDLIYMAAKIRRTIADPAFSNYFFVFGTAIYAQSTVDPETPWWEQSNLTGNELLYYNFAPVFKGGLGHNHFYIVLKKYISIGDFFKRSTLPDPRDVEVKFYAAGNASVIFADTLARHGVRLVEDHLIELDGIRIGVEVCLDHLVGTLSKSIHADDRKLVDVQLITSAGMAIEDGPNPVVPGGVVYLCDGEASSAACMRTDKGKFNPGKVCVEPPDGLKHIPLQSDGYSNFITMSSCLDVQAMEQLKGYYSLYQTQGCAFTLSKYGIDVMDEFKLYPPSIEIYPTIDLPNLRQVY